MSAMRRGGLVLTLTIAAGLGAVAPAQGAVTIGSSLATQPMQNAPGCNIACTAVNLALPLAAQAPGGLSSPINGVATSWRARANTGNNLRLRILRPVVATTFTGVGTSDPASFAGPGISPSFPSALAVKVGDFVGLESPSGNLIYSATAGATGGFWNMPILLDGTTRATDGTAANGEVNIQAVIEPDIDCDKLGDETQDGIIRQGCLAKVLGGSLSGNTLNLSVQCPLVTQNCDSNLITLTATPPVKVGGGKAAAAKKKKKKKKASIVTTIATATATVPAGQTATVPVTLSGTPLALLKTHPTVSAEATISSSLRTLKEPVTLTGQLKPKKKKKKKKR